jgi:phage terminase large subunit-like protein
VPTGSSPELPVCGFLHEAVTGEMYECTARGDHFCEPRALRVIAFFDEVLVHTKGQWAGRRFTLSAWQEHEIIRPLFGTVRWSAEHQMYVRQDTVAWIEVGRKNGKTELAAGIALYLLEGDKEEGAEIFGAAKDTVQAGLVWEVAERMVKLSPHLRGRLGINRASRRIYNERTGSYYRTVTRDAAGELGLNPHGIIFDEVIAQPDGELWNALRTGMGARTQPLMLALTTAGNDPSSFAAELHAEMQRITEDPARAPHVFTFIRNTPTEADIWDEANWAGANPALGDFLSIETLRQEAQEARNDPRAENAFRQFRGNQWVQQVTRWMPLHLWDACTGEVAATPDWLLPKLEGRRCYGGLDLSARFDLTALCWWFPETDSQPASSLWRLWVPEAVLPALDKATGGTAGAWARAGWLTVTDGDVIDYEAVYECLVADHNRFRPAAGAYDEWSGEPVRQQILERTGLDWTPIRNSYTRMTPALNELMRLVKARGFQHGGNPAVRWCVDSLEVRHAREDATLIRPSKPDRQKSARRIDAVTALLLALLAEQAGEAEEQYAAPSAMWV